MSILIRDERKAGYAAFDAVNIDNVNNAAL